MKTTRSSLKLVPGNIKSNALGNFVVTFLGGLNNT
jgi:hypothetical protein